MLKIRCSEIHHIIGTPKKAGETLTQTAKTHLLNTFKRQQFGFTRFKGTGCTEKGKFLEDTAVKASGMVRGKVYAKNTVRRENDFITGECDIHDPAARLIIDTKCSWDIGTLWGSNIYCIRNKRNKNGVNLDKHKAYAVFNRKSVCSSFYRKWKILVIIWEKTNRVLSKTGQFLNRIYQAFKNICPAVAAAVFSGLKPMKTGFHTPDQLEVQVALVQIHFKRLVRLVFR